MDRCVIISAGKIEDYNSTKKLINKNDVIVCADGGYIHAKNMGLKVDCVIGDFDSSKEPETENKIVLPVEKDVTDTFYCVDEYTKKGYKNFLILGCLGGRFDHSYSNVLLLKYLLKNGCNAVLQDESNKIYLIEENEKTIKFSDFGNISFFAFDSEVKDLNIINAKYNLSDYDLKTEDSLCISNSFVDNKDITIKKQSGILLAIESK